MDRIVVFGRSLGGAVAVDVGTGEVTLVDLTGAVDVSVATGSVIGVDLDVPAARIWVGEGDVDLQLLAPVAELDVAVYQGGVRLSGG